MGTETAKKVKRTEGLTAIPISNVRAFCGAFLYC